jgi:hypothetical protein
VDIRLLDAYDSISTDSLLKSSPNEDGSTTILPMVPRAVQTVLYFEIDMDRAAFTYKFKNKIPNVK